MSYDQPRSPLYQRCPHTNKLFAYYPVSRDPTMMSTLLQPPPTSSRPGGDPSNQQKPRKERVSTRHRLASMFTRRSLDDSSPASPSGSDPTSDAETLSDAKSISRGIFRRKTTSSQSTKSTSTLGSKGNAKEAKKSVTFSEASSSRRDQRYSSNAYPSAWSYVVW